MLLVEQRGFLVIRWDIGGRVAPGPSPCPGGGRGYLWQCIPREAATASAFISCDVPLLSSPFCATDQTRSPKTRAVPPPSSWRLAAPSPLQWGPPCLSQTPLTAVRFRLVFSSEAFASLGKTESHTGSRHRKISAIPALPPCIFP